MAASAAALALLPALLAPAVAGAHTRQGRQRHCTISGTRHAGRRNATTGHRRARAGHRHSSCAVTAHRRAASAPLASYSAHHAHSELAAIASRDCTGSELTPSTSDIAALRSAVACLINRERARNGVQPLHYNARAQLAAQRHSEDMVANNYFEHVTPGGETPAERLRAAHYIYSSHVGYTIGENIAWGTLTDATPKAIVEAWMASPGHRENILDGHFHETGIGIDPQLPGTLGEGQPGAMYTQDFGTIIKP